MVQKMPKQIKLRGVLCVDMVKQENVDGDKLCCLCDFRLNGGKFPQLSKICGKYCKSINLKTATASEIKQNTPAHPLYLYLSET